MLALVCTALPAFVLPAQSANTLPRATIKALTYSDGELPQMYRDRWASSSAVDSKDKQEPSFTDTAAQIGGAMLGVTAIASLGAFKSAGETPIVLNAVQNTWGYGSTDDVSVYLDAITGWVADCNALLTPSVSFASIVIAFDVVALVSMVALVTMAITEERLTGPSAANDPALCLANTLTDEPVCGPASFDSTDGYACVETWVDGRLVWQCA